MISEGFLYGYFNNNTSFFRYPVYKSFILGKMKVPQTGGSTDGPDGSTNGPDGNTDGLDGSAGSVGAWLAGVECLKDWERNLRLGDLRLDTSAQSECARARFIIGLLALHNFQFELAQEEFEKASAVND